MHGAVFLFDLVCEGEGVAVGLPLSLCDIPENSPLSPVGDIPPQ